MRVYREETTNTKNPKSMQLRMQDFSLNRRLAAYLIVNNAMNAYLAGQYPPLNNLSYPLVIAKQLRVKK